MAIVVRPAFGAADETYPDAVDYVVHDDGSMSLTDKPATDETYHEVGTYAAGQWLRVLINAPASTAP